MSSAAEYEFPFLAETWHLIGVGEEEEEMFFFHKNKILSPLPSEVPMPILVKSPKMCGFEVTGWTVRGLARMVMECQSGAKKQCPHCPDYPLIKTDGSFA